MAKGRWCRSHLLDTEPNQGAAEWFEITVSTLCGFPGEEDTTTSIAHGRWGPAGGSGQFTPVSLIWTGHMGVAGAWGLWWACSAGDHKSQLGAFLPISCSETSLLVARNWPGGFVHTTEIGNHYQSRIFPGGLVITITPSALGIQSWEFWGWMIYERSDFWRLNHEQFLELFHGNGNSAMF